MIDTHLLLRKGFSCMGCVGGKPFCAVALEMLSTIFNCERFYKKGFDIPSSASCLLLVDGKKSNRNLQSLGLCWSGLDRYHT